MTAVLENRFQPAPGAAPLRQMVGAQAALETRQLLRNGEQLTLTLIIPLLLLAAFSLEPLISFGGGYTRIDFLTPGVIALAIMSTAFTSQAIATGFERRYGVLKRLGATPLSRAGLIAAKTLTVIGVELLQAVIILLVALALGWSPDASPAAIVVVPLLILLGTAAFSGFALLLAGTLRAEATLAAANLIYVVLLGVGGVVFPLTKFPVGARTFLELLPTGALSTGLRHVLANGEIFPVRDVVDPGGMGGHLHHPRGPLLPVGVRRGNALPAGLVLAGAVSVQTGRRHRQPPVRSASACLGDDAAALGGRAGPAHRRGPPHRPGPGRPEAPQGLVGRPGHGRLRRHPRLHELRHLPGLRPDPARHRGHHRVPRPAHRHRRRRPGRQRDRPQPRASPSATPCWPPSASSCSPTARSAT